MHTSRPQDGVLALDEAHKARNLVTTGKRSAKSSKTALVIHELQARLRNARVVYSSATIATE